MFVWLWTQSQRCCSNWCWGSGRWRDPSYYWPSREAQKTSRCPLKWSRPSAKGWSLLPSAQERGYSLMALIQVSATNGCKICVGQYLVLLLNNTGSWYALTLPAWQFDGTKRLSLSQWSVCVQSGQVHHQYNWRNSRTPLRPGQDVLKVNMFQSCCWPRCKMTDWLTKRLHSQGVVSRTVSRLTSSLRD